MKGYKRYQWFSLVELIIVISIIVFLSAMVTLGAIYARQHARYTRTRSQLQMLVTALVQYNTEQGFYPRQNSAAPLTVNMVRSLVKENGQRILTMEEDIFRESKGKTYVIDAYGNPFYYQCPGTMNTKSFDLWSMGPDGCHGAKGSSVNDAHTVAENDDITNWKSR